MPSIPASLARDHCEKLGRYAGLATDMACGIAESRAETAVELGLDPSPFVDDPPLQSRHITHFDEWDADFKRVLALVPEVTRFRLIELWWRLQVPIGACDAGWLLDFTNAKLECEQLIQAETMSSSATATCGVQCCGTSPKGTDDESLQDWAGSLKLSVNIVYGDIRESANQNREHGDEAHTPFVDRLVTRIKTMAKKHGGRAKGEGGDAVIGLFKAACQAQDFAFELAKINNLEETLMRIGIHHGEVALQGNEIKQTNAVNLANRIASQSDGNTIWCSDHFYELVRAARPSDCAKWTQHHQVVLKGYEDKPKTIWSAASKQS